MKLHRQLGSSRLRARVWLHQLELDRALAAGADCHASAELETRANQLQSVHFRRRLLADASEELEELRDALRHGDEIPVSELARAACLLDDPSGPLYRRSEGDVTLTELAHLAAIACSPGTPPAREP